uniref:Protection of telomeres 1 protein n=1 Tax=Helianthus argophyllus TaxID=73275 RepID=B7T1J6_9ASTR|nr:protection of telomeres 1 protein [Helianthus argophyllus]
MSNLKSDDNDDYKFLRIIDAMASINQKVNLIGVITEIGISKQSRGTDCCCTIKIVDESNASSGISVNFFAENFEKLPHVESAGDIIQLVRVVMKSHRSGVNVLFDKKFSSFAIYEGREGSKFSPYQVSSKFHGRDQDKKFIAGLRKWTVSHRPETASNDFLSLKDIKQGNQSTLICKVLHVCEVKDGEWLLFVWDGTDAPPVNIHTKLDEEFDNPLPLQLESIPLSRNVLCKFPTVGTVLRMTNGNCNEKLGLHLLKPGKWVQFKNINFEVRYGLWCGILLSKSKFSFLPDDDDHAIHCRRTYEEQAESKWDRKPFTCLPWPSKVTDTDHQDVPFVTLMDVLTYPEVIAKFRCVVRVVATLPGHPRDFKAPCGTYRIRLTLEDPTARIHAYIYAEDGVKFFWGYPSIDAMIKKHNALLGVEETDDADSDEKPRNPPWVECCLCSYNIDETDVWGSIRYRIFDTTLVG